jgi:hypothetical protein
VCFLSMVLARCPGVFMHSIRPSPASRCPFPAATSRRGGGEELRGPEGAQKGGQG